ncbi:MarR family transcriptional regulator [Chloroflexales bacterium ZM16-3]|nr:MarR family transcriptional regulator [Chloroflexales bacterium ZM16-3]
MPSARQEPQTARTAEHSTLEEIERAIMQISWLAQRQFMQLLDEERFRITLPQFYTLIHLHQVGEECKMSDLADATHQSAASLTGVVDRLAEKQLVERTRHERDRRQVMVVITTRGIELISEVRQARREQMQMALGQLSEQEIDTFMQILDQVLSGMVRVTERGEGGRLA